MGSGPATNPHRYTRNWQGRYEGFLPPAGFNGRALARMICKKHGKRFTAAE